MFVQADFLTDVVGFFMEKVSFSRHFNNTNERKVQHVLERRCNTGAFATFGLTIAHVCAKCDD